MKIKLIIGIILMILISVVTLIWYASETSVRIENLELPYQTGAEYKGYEIGTLDTGFLYITLLNNASSDVNITLKIKNALEDEKGNSIPSYVLVYGSDREPYTINEPIGEVNLKPGKNQLRTFFGYQVPGLKKIEVKVYQKGRLIDAKSVEIRVLPPVIGVA
ncbi:MAG: hypothetical protein Q8N79_01605, partial [Candidatus Methanoperedens sp.]|nr:hypothetical protein [Candidatus Methanoperedens sp.]